MNKWKFMWKIQDLQSFGHLYLDFYYFSMRDDRLGLGFMSTYIENENENYVFLKGHRLEGSFFSKF